MNTVDEETKKFLSDHIEGVIKILRNESNISIPDVLTKLGEDICFIDSNTEIKRHYIIPIMDKTRDEVIAGLEYIRSKYILYGHPFFNRW